MEGKFAITGIGAHCAGSPMFIPGTEVGKNHTIITVIVNRGKSKAGVELKSEVTLNIWGKYAGAAACHLDKGRKIDFEGELLSHTTDTGTVTPAGKKMLNRRNEVRVSRFYFSGDTKKELMQRVSKNLAALQATGQPITPDALLNISRNKTIEYNPVLSAQTGMYGNARVWIGNSFIKANAAIVVPAPAAPVPAPAQVVAKTMEELMSEQAALVKAVTDAQNPANALDAFLGA